VQLPLRPTEQDRTRAIGQLKKGYVNGRLSTETFEERIAVAQSTRSWATLRGLLEDVSPAWRAASTLLPARRTPRDEIVPQVTLLLSRWTDGPVVVGRAHGCELVFGGPAVSRRHAAFERVGGGWHIQDLRSRNGTFVDDVQVERAPVGPGSRVRLGDSFLEIA
jgi:FHA domain/Domain of unknown function (DUF1707)